MKKTFILEDLCCANCAAKMQDAISKFEGVTKCTVTFLTQKMIIECEDARADEITKKAIEIIGNIEPDVTVIEK